MADAENNVAHDEVDDTEDIEVDAKEEKTGNWEVDVENFISSLAPEVRRRLLALKNIQLDVTKLEADFYAEMHLLEEKYLPLYLPLFEKRCQITTGAYEPNDAECDFPLGEAEEVAAKVKDMNLEKGKDKEAGDAKEKVVGIPDFWLKIFRNVEMLDDSTEEYDVPIIKHLTDIKVELSSKPMGFKLHFHFSPNEYFKNSVLTKSYEMKCEVDKEDPFSFEGPEIIKCTGCSIDWYPNKNVTVKVIKKKQKHKQRGSVRIIHKTVDARSFFNFFNPPQLPENEVDEEIQLRLTTDFELGQYIRERIIPRAVLFFTGEALDDDEEDEDEFDDEDEDEEGEEEDDDEEKEETKGAVPQRTQGGGRRGQQGKNPNQDCKQQ